MPAPTELALAVAVLVAVVGGYAAGSIPVAALVGRLAGIDVHAAGERNPGSANVWKLAGPVAGLTALAGDLAKGILPTALGAATIGWGIGWLAGLGAILGHAWPALGRWPGGRAVATFCGVCIALVPLAAAGAIVLLVAVGIGVALRGGRARVPALVTAIAAYPILVAAVERDVGRLAAVGVLYLATVARFVRTANR